MIVLLEERETIEADHLLRNTGRPEEVAYGFRDEQNDLWEKVNPNAKDSKTNKAYHRRQDICQGTSQLEHDDNDSHSEPHHSA